MDLNAKSPSSQWEWDHLPLPDTKATENKKLQPPNWSIKLDRENNVWLFDTPTGSGYSGSELIPGSTSGSSKSDSISSSPTRDISKTCKFAFESSHDDSNGKIELPKEGPIEASNAPMLSCVSSEPLLNLKLGKRMKFEDVSSLVFGRKCKSNDQNLQCPPLCQVEGCGLDLSSAKHYYRKRRVCVDHSKSPMVVIDGLERRFCQQCSRFHDLFEFDGKKKSCRRRLSQHNARRRNHSRKTAQSSQSALSSSPCGC
ncbi:putative transcription factor SBP family [Medicago truncatula]|uniref:Putative transcription factor SBP family n=1 Tax=Medicago truncatula TaxID=3880 RepID=A0A396GUK6_MEDTR|nr:putative transcription factor SBP family [Medicago truncatula]